jgi:hypothetical protein
VRTSENKGTSAATGTQAAKKAQGSAVPQATSNSKNDSITTWNSKHALKKILEREDQYLYVARRTFTNLILGINSLNVLRAAPDLTQLSLESIYL